MGTEPPLVGPGVVVLEPPNELVGVRVEVQLVEEEPDDVVVVLVTVKELVLDDVVLEVVALGVCEATLTTP